jgi:O-antigen ligase
VSTIYTVIERGLGQGIKISGLSTSSPLERVGVRAGDTILEINGKAVNDPSMLELAYGPEPRIKIYRYELIQVLEPESIELLPGQTPVQRLGIERWQRGRDWRASGFYGHYATYAEVLQLIGSLVIGLLVASSGLKRRVLLSLVAALFLISLLFTITRAAWASFLISSLLILSLSMGRRFLLLLPIILIPVVAAGLFILQQKRNVGFFDRKDGSIQWRETVYREGLELLISNPRHMVTGIGMDSIKRRWREWGLFDNGRLPIGHMHSTPLQVALERGLPALLCWLGLLFVYIRLLMHTLKRKSLHWIEKGTILGAIGGTAGFFLSGIVHYNLGDSEVMMVFYLIMGICLVIYRERKDLTVHSP